MASPVSYPVTLQAKQVWAARQAAASGITTVLLMNTDLVNTVNVGTSLTSIVVPVPPNGSLSVDPGSNWYVQGSVAGTQPLVVVPNGQSTFRGLTQGLGALSIPSIFSPDFVHGVSGWSIQQNGNAEFNNLVIRGTFFGLDFIINSLGIFVYNGLPATGNLIGSWAPAAGANDGLGNPFKKDLATYAAVNSSFVNVTSTGAAGGFAGVLVHPAGSVHVTEEPQVGAAASNPGAANEQSFLSLGSGRANGNDSAFMQFVSQSADGTAGGFFNCQIGTTILFQLLKTVWNISVPISCTLGTPANSTLIRTDTWNNIILDANWTALGGQSIPGYMLSIENRVYLEAALQFNVNIGNNNINGGNPLPVRYRPPTQKFIAGGPGAAGVAVNTNGVLTATSGGITTVFCNFNGSYTLDR